MRQCLARPYMGPNSGWECPIFLIILAIASPTCLVPTFGQFLFAIRYRQGPFSETGELHMILIKFRKIAANIPLFDEALFRTLIAAGVPHFWHQFAPLLADLFSPEMWTAIIRDYPPQRAILETDESPRILIKFRTVLGELPLFDEDLF